VLIDTRVTPLAQNDGPGRMTRSAVGPLVVAGKVTLATASLTGLPSRPDSAVPISDVFLPALARVGQEHGASVSVAHWIVTDSRDGVRSAGDAGCAARESGITD
jgi:hypothetical protein